MTSARQYRYPGSARACIPLVCSLLLPIAVIAAGAALAQSPTGDDSVTVTVPLSPAPDAAPAAAPQTAPQAAPAAAPAASTKKAAAKKPAPTVTAKATPDAPVRSGNAQSIAVLVNDEPITGYEIEQRIALSMLGSPDIQRRLQAKLKAGNINDLFKAFAMKRLQANPPKTEAEQQARIKQLQGEFVDGIKKQVAADYAPAARKQALDELIDERLKLQEAKRLNVIAADDEIDRIVSGMAERNKMNAAQFAEHISKMGANVTAMKDRIRASLSWQDVVRRKYGHLVNVAARDIDRMVATTEGQDSVDLRIQRILFALPTKMDQKQVAQRLSEAEQLRNQFTNCKGMEELARKSPGARFDNFGERHPTSIPEPTRSLLLSAHDEEILPPSIGESGIELWAVCGRKVVKAEDTKRETAENELRQKEFEILSKKALNDLRQDAHIEYR